MPPGSRGQEGTVREGLAQTSQPIWKDKPHPTKRANCCLVRSQDDMNGSPWSGSNSALGSFNSQSLGSMRSNGDCAKNTPSYAEGSPGIQGLRSSGEGRGVDISRWIRGLTGDTSVENSP